MCITQYRNALYTAKYGKKGGIFSSLQYLNYNAFLAFLCLLLTELGYFFNIFNMRNKQTYKDQPNEKKQRLFILGCYSKRSQPPSLAFWQRLKGRQRGKALQWKEGKPSDVPSLETWHVETVGRPTRSAHPTG